MAFDDAPDSDRLEFGDGTSFKIIIRSLGFFRSQTDQPLKPENIWTSCDPLCDDCPCQPREFPVGRAMADNDTLLGFSKSSV